MTDSAGSAEHHLPEESLQEEYSAQEQYASQALALAALADQVGDWAAPSPCEGWTALDVLDHVIETQRDYLQRKLLDVGPRPVGDPAAVWRSHAQTVMNLLGDPAVGESEIDGYFGTTTIGETLSTFYGFDMIVHRWDIATAVGLPCRFSVEELDLIRASLVVFGDALYSEGVCRGPLSVQPDADEQTELLAVLGRVG